MPRRSDNTKKGIMSRILLVATLIGCAENTHTPVVQMDSIESPTALAARIASFDLRSWTSTADVHVLSDYDWIVDQKRSSYNHFMIHDHKVFFISSDEPGLPPTQQDGRWKRADYVLAPGEARALLNRLQEHCTEGARCSTEAVEQLATDLAGS
jgi:hypothetical protein